MSLYSPAQVSRVRGTSLTVCLLFRPRMVPSLVNRDVLLEGCVSLERQFIMDNIDLYYNVYYCFRVVFIHIAPCCILVVLNALLVVTIRQASDEIRHSLTSIIQQLATARLLLIHAINKHVTLI